MKLKQVEEKVRDSARFTSIQMRGVKLPGRIQVQDLTIHQGQCLVVCGPNGSGKSSLLRILSGLESKFSGEVLFDEEDVRKLSRRQIAARVAWLPQRPTIGETMTCEAIVAAARFRFLESPEKSMAEARLLLNELQTAHLGARPSEQVSGGELQRVLIAALVAQETPFLLVDEPANHLDPRHQVATYQHLAQLWRKRGRTIVVVTHDVRLAQLLGPPEEVDLLAVNDGKVQFQSTLATPELGHLLSDLYGVPFAGADDPGGLAVRLPGHQTRNDGRE